MADTSIRNVGPDIAQLSNKLSFLEKSQINAIRNMGGPSAEAGRITGDVTTALNSVSAAQRSAMEIGADLASKLESLGVHSKSTRKLVDSSVQTTVNERTTLPVVFPDLPVDLSNRKNRVPDANHQRPGDVIKSSREDILGQGDLQYGGETYPLSLADEAPAYVRLQFYKYKRPNSFSAGNISTPYFAELPIPDNLSLNFSATFQQRDTGQLGQLMQGAAGAKAADAAGNVKGGPAARAGAAVLSIGDSTLNADSTQALNSIKTVAERALFTELASAEEVVGGLAEQLAGAIPNPHPTVFFKGMELRTFQWSWKFVPRSQEEAATLAKMLKNIRKYILPAKEDGGAFLQYPHLIQPKIIGQNVEMYGKFKKSAVTQFSINYTGEGTSAFFVDGNPVSVICSMSFQEIENFTSEDA